MDFWFRRGVSDEHTLQRSVRSEQRSLSQKDMPPGGLHRIWLLALLLLGHRSLRICSLVAPRQKPNAVQQMPTQFVNSTLGRGNASGQLGGNPLKKQRWKQDRYGFSASGVGCPDCRGDGLLQRFQRTDCPPNRIHAGHTGRRHDHDHLERRWHPRVCHEPGARNHLDLDERQRRLLLRASRWRSQVLPSAALAGR